MHHFYRSRETFTDLAVLVAAIALVFGRAVGNDFIANWDDSQYVLENRVAWGFSLEHLREAFRVGAFSQYNPLALVSYMLDYTLWGLWPGGYHLTNILLHAVNGLLVYRLLAVIRGDRLTCLLGSLFFVVHPVQVESVAWISERKGLLATGFFLISWLSYLRYRDGGAAAGRFYGISLAAFLFSLLAKSSTVVLPVVLLMYDVCHPAASGRLKLKDKVPYLLLALAAAGVEIYSSLLQPGGTRGVYHGGSALATFYTMLPVFCRYLGLLLWPAGLSIDYDPPIHHGLDGVVALSLLVLALVLFLSVRLYRRNRELAFWVGFFWLCLAPVSQIIPLGFIMFDHYLYLPAIGVGVLAGAAAVRLKERLLPQTRWLFYLSLGLWLGGLSLVSLQRTAVWENSLTLFTAAVRSSPHSFMAWWGLGNAHEAAGRKDLALAEYLHAATLKPDSTDVLYTVAALYLERGAPDEALPRLRRVLELNPAYVRGWAAMGRYHRLKNDFVRAEGMYLQALKLQPDAVEVMLALAGLAAAQGDVAPAAAWLEKAFAAGWRDYQAVTEDRDFASIRDEARFVRAMDRLFPDRSGR